MFEMLLGGCWGRSTARAGKTNCLQRGKGMVGFGAQPATPVGGRPPWWGSGRPALGRGTAAGGRACPHGRRYGRALAAILVHAVPQPPRPRRTRRPLAVGNPWQGPAVAATGGTLGRRGSLRPTRLHHVVRLEARPAVLPSSRRLCGGAYVLGTGQPCRRIHRHREKHDRRGRQGRASGRRGCDPPPADVLPRLPRHRQRPPLLAARR